MARANACSGDSCVSVVIPVWDEFAGQVLARAVASVGRASRSGVELIVVDNASSVPVSVPGATVLRLSSRVSVGPARNAGFELVCTPLVVFLDADDELVPGSLDVLVGEYLRASARRDDVVAVCGVVIDRFSGRRYPWPRGFMVRLAVFPRAFRLLELCRASFPVNGSVLVADSVRDSGGFSEHADSAEDWVLGVSLAWRGSVWFVRTPALVYASRCGGAWGSSLTWFSQRKFRSRVRERAALDTQVSSWVSCVAPVVALVQTIDLVRELLPGTVCRKLGRFRVGSVGPVRG